MWEIIIEYKLYVHLLLELMAAIAGLIYLRKSKTVSPEIRIFIYYLCYIFIIETYGLLPIYAWVTNYEVLSFYEDSVFGHNFWWANLNMIIYSICFSQIYIRNLSSRNQRNFLWTALIGVVGFSIFRFSTTGEFFVKTDSYVSVLQTFIVFLSVCFWYLEILKSDKIIYFYKDLKFFISVGIVLWSLLKTPLDIYSAFSNLANEDFWELDQEILRYLNVFLYSMYILGFYADYQFRNKPKTLKT